jgi:hypothetical protein
MVDDKDVKILKKLLNHKIFLDKFPEITYVAVDEFGQGIDVVFFYRDGVGRDETKLFRPKAGNLVQSLAQMAGVKSRLNIYPQF